MLYILIVMWFGDSSYYSGKAALAVEFNDRSSCMSAAAEIRRQERGSAPIGTLFCAPKGK